MLAIPGMGWIPRRSPCMLPAYQDRPLLAPPYASPPSTHQIPPNPYNTN